MRNGSKKEQEKPSMDRIKKKKKRIAYWKLNQGDLMRE